MILNCNFEELTALGCGARSFLGVQHSDGQVAAPSATRLAVESLLGSLGGELSLSTLGEQIEVERAVQAIVDQGFISD